MIYINVMSTAIRKHLNNRRWRERHPEQARQHSLEGGRKRRAVNSQAVKAYHARYTTEHSRAIRNNHLIKLGWTIDRFDAYLLAQEGRCAICKRFPLGKASWPHKKPVLNADHEHCVPPKPRALLCSKCNGAIGLLEENVGYFKAAIAYLEYWSNNGGAECLTTLPCS